MEETLKDARLTHRLLIAGAVVLCIFALSSPSDIDFAAIKRSLQRLQNLDTKPLKSQIDNALTAELNRAGFFRELQVYNQALPPLRLAPKHFQWGQYSEIDTGVKSIGRMSIIGITEYLSRPHPVKVFLPNMSKLFQALTDKRSVFVINSDELGDTFRLDFSRPENHPEWGYRLFLNWTHPDPYQASHGIGRFEEIGDYSFPGSEVALGDIDVSKWIKVQIGDADVSSILQPVWDDVKDDDLARAIVRLDSMEARAARTVEITNFKVPSSLAIVIGPMALLFLLLTLLVHIIHLSEIRETDTSMLHTFGWEALYGHQLARLLSFSSIVILPLAASILITLRCPEPHMALRIIAWLLTILTTASSLVVWWKSCRLLAGIR